jgi:hypothetical protein
MRGGHLTVEHQRIVLECAGYGVVADPETVLAPYDRSILLISRRGWNFQL